MPQSSYFDLVLMDIQMPVMDGLSATSLIRKDDRFGKLPIVAMTAHAMRGDFERSLQAGMNDHLTKPINFAKLTETLLRWIPAGPKLTASVISRASASGEVVLPAALPPFDLTAALVRTNGKPLLLRKLIAGFYTSYRNAAGDLQSLLQGEKNEEALRLLHTLKGVSATLEARELAEMARLVESELQRQLAEQLRPNLSAFLINRFQEALRSALGAAASLSKDEPPPAVLPAAETIAHALVARSKPRILVVDDQQINIDLLSGIFEADCEIVSATDGASALRLAATAMPDLILLDVVMPGIDGYEVCRRLKQDPVCHDIAIMFITGSGNASSETKALKLGAVDYITKPMNPAAVKARVHNYLAFKLAQEEVVRLAAEEHKAQMIVELQRSEEKDRARMQELKLKDDFLSHVSHEIRSPLTSIYSFSTILADGLAGEMTAQQDEYVQIILKNVAQLRAMVEDLLEVTQSRTGKLAVTLQPVALAEAAREAMNTLQGASAAKGITLSGGWTESLPEVLADPVRLRQVLIILLDNAVKFTHKGGQVTLKATVWDQDAQMLLISVKDTGRGIPPDMTESVFEHLRQVTIAEEEGRKGLGLGLHIAKDLVTRQGGSIWIESVLGQGSEFFFTLPVIS